MTYALIESVSDRDISYLSRIHSLPEISRYISIDEENYWNYVTLSENVFYYKIYDSGILVGTVHLEIYEDTLYISILIIPEYQNKGIAAGVINDIKNGVMNSSVKRIEASVDRTNTPSNKLFVSSGFREVSEDGELINYIWEK